MRTIPKDFTIVREVNLRGKKRYRVDGPIHYRFEVSGLHGPSNLYGYRRTWDGAYRLAKRSARRQAKVTWREEMTWRNE